MKLKLQGFELEIEGNRDDASIISRSIGDQIASVISPGVNIVEGEFSSAHSANNTAPAVPLISEAVKRRGGRRSRNTTAVAGEVGEAAAIDFRNDPAKYATPTQQWKTADKAIWLLYVVKEVTGVSDLSTGQIMKTFNTHFRQAKTITASNVSRDLGKLKVSSPSLVGEDNTKSVGRWFLTEEGVRRAQALIANAQSPAAA
jgi:hypothetical protein